MQLQAQSKTQKTANKQSPFGTDHLGPSIRIVDSIFVEQSQKLDPNGVQKAYSQESIILQRDSELSYDCTDFNENSNDQQAGVNNILASTIKISQVKPFQLDQQQIVKQVFESATQEFVKKVESCDEDEEISEKNILLEPKPKASKKKSLHEKRFSYAEEKVESKSPKKQSDQILKTLNEIKQGISGLSPIVNFLFNKKSDLPLLQKIKSQENSPKKSSTTQKKQNSSPAPNIMGLLFEGNRNKDLFEEQLESQKQQISQKEDTYQYQVNEQKTIQESGFLTFRTRRLKKHIKNLKTPEKVAEEDSQLEIPELEIQQFPTSATKKQVFQIVKSIFQKFNKTEVKSGDIKIKQFKNGYEVNLLKTKQTIIWLANGSFYIGDYDQGEGKTGKGFEFKPQKYKYLGYFTNGKKHGKGVIKTIEGVEYNGSWYKGSKRGFGRQVDSFGNQYIGEWDNNKYQGKGQQFFTNGQKFEGQFSQGVRNGWGVWKNGLGDMYKGNYTNNKKDGYGEYFWGNGKVFKGEWKNDFKVRSSSLNQSSNERNKSSSHLDISQNEEKVKRHFKNKRSLSILPVVKKPITNTQQERIGYDIQTIGYHRFSHRKSFQLKKK